jgi:biotin transport system ATP-binding protein
VHLQISFDAAGVSYDDKAALQPLTVDLSERRIGVIGLNGSGKSTFARLINGLVKPTTGKVTVDGLDTASDKQKLLGKIGYVFQNPHNQIIMPIIKDDIAFGLKRLKLSSIEEAARINAALSRLKIEHLADRRAHELSGGELQLAALASLLVTKPDLLIMDEPTNQLDLRNRALIEQTIAELPEQVVTISHDLALIEGFDRVLVFHQGHLHFDGAPSDALETYKQLALA